MKQTKAGLWKTFLACLLALHLAAADNGGAAVRHPEEKLAYVNVSPVNPPLHQMSFEYHVSIGDLHQGAEYLVELQVTNGAEHVWKSSNRFIHSGDNHASVVSFTVPGLTEGSYRAQATVHDLYPGLTSDDSFLTMKTHFLTVVPRPDTGKVKLECKSKRLVWPKEGTDSVKPAAGDVSVCSVASIDRSLAALHLSAQWEGPMALAFYARNEEEETALMEFVQTTLGPYCESKSQPLRVRLLSMCYTTSAPSSIIGFPVNLLRSNSVEVADTDLVLYLDVDFLPSKGAHSLVKHAFRNGGLNRADSVAVLPCFMTTPETSWPHPPQLHRDPESKLQVKVDSMNPTQLKEQFDKGHVEVPGLPTSFHSHGPSDYRRFFALSNSSNTDGLKPYKVDYSFWFEPYFAIDKKNWKGVAGNGLFDTRFYLWGGDKAQLSYEVATLGYTFYVQPGAFIVHAPKTEAFKCHIELGEICEVASKTKVKWEERNGYVENEVTDFIRSLPPWRGHVPDGHSGICYLPPHEYLQDLNRHVVGEKFWSVLRRVTDAWTEKGKSVKEVNPEVDADGKEHEQWFWRKCFDAPPLVGRFILSGSSVLLIFDERALHGVNYPENITFNHWVQHRNGYQQMILQPDVEISQLLGHRETAFHVPNNTKCKEHLLANAKGLQECHVNTELDGVDAEKTRYGRTARLYSDTVASPQGVADILKRNAKVQQAKASEEKMLERLALVDPENSSQGLSPAATAEDGKCTAGTCTEDLKKLHQSDQALSEAGAVESLVKRHPESLLVAVRIQERTGLRAGEPIQVPVHLVNLQHGSSYAVSMQVVDPGNAQDGGLLVIADYEFAFVHEDSKDHEKDQRSFVIDVRPLPPGRYHAEVAVFDTFPGLNEDDAFLSIGRIDLQVDQPE